MAQKDREMRNPAPEVEKLVPFFGLEEIVEFQKGLELVHDFILELAFVLGLSPLRDRPDNPGQNRIVREGFFITHSYKNG